MSAGMSGKKTKVFMAAVLSFVLAAASPLGTLAAASGVFEEYRAGSAGGASFVESEYTVVEIATEEELAELAQACTLDTWSRDKYVKLMNDIELRENRGLCIPSFGGIFDGAGYSVTNLRVDGPGSARGLFRYIQETGRVKNLSVEGSVTAEGSQNRMGGIAGVNYGQIINCSFSGRVTGDSEVGGIAGVNEEGGEIRRCQSGALVTGNHSTGGIVGNNHGILNNCSNSGSVNTHSTEVTYELEDITAEDLEDWNSTSRVAVHTDTGGIAGLSDGKIYYCTNSGTVGYQHVGYNVGGIAGRLHQGYLQNCTNTGHILGRKDVGGIVGQMEPFLEVEYMEDKLQELDRETEIFLNLLEGANHNLDGYGSRAAELSRSISASLQNANAAGAGLLNTGNELWYIYNQELAGIGTDFKNLGQELGDQGSSDKENGNVHDVTVSGGNLSITIPNDMESYKAALRRFGESAGNHLDQITSATGDRSGSVTDNLNTLNSELDSAGRCLEELVSVLGDGATGAGSDRDGLVAQARVMSRLVGEIRDDLFRYEGISVEDVSDEAASREEGTPGAKPGDGLGESDAVSRESDAVSGESDAVSRESDLNSEAFYDTSSFQQGKVTLSINKGNVEADTNVGGIVGQISIEYDLDPEDDITLTGVESFNIERTIKAVVRDSRNLGDVSSKKDYAGGIAGKADYGAIISCESYGDVSSASGSYAGGIAGGSGYAVRSCYVMGGISAKNYVGGIVGKGSDIFYCCAYPELSAGGEQTGAIAGQLEDQGMVAGNYYVDGGVGGIDGIGYQGGATPVSYEELCRVDGLPDAFSQFTVTFLAQGRELASFQCGYGDSIDREQMPEIPKQEGFYGIWPGEELAFVTGNRVVEAQYEKWISALESGDRDESGRSYVLAEGQFLPGSKLELSEAASGEGREITLEITSPRDGEAISDAVENGRYVGPVEVRILCDGDLRVEALQDGGFAEVQTRVMGSYLVFHMECPGTFRVTKVQDYSTIIICITAGGLGAFAVLILLAARRIKRRRARKRGQGVTGGE